MSTLPGSSVTAGRYVGSSLELIDTHDTISAWDARIIRLRYDPFNAHDHGITRMRRSPAREARIRDEIIVDARDGSEQAMGWYYYLDDTLRFPFEAQCVAECGISPLQKGETVTVLGMAPAAECEHEIVVRTQWQGRSFGVPLMQLKANKGDAHTRQGVEDWHYWVGQGYVF